MIPVILLVLYFIFKWCQDTVDHHYERSVFTVHDFFRHDWTRKYYLGDPKFGRNIIPVWLLDGWHFFGMLRNLMVCFLFAELTEWNIIIDMAFYLVVLNVTMHILYKRVLLKSN